MKRARFLEYQGKQWRLHELAAHLGIRPDTLLGRAEKGLPLDVPQRTQHKKKDPSGKRATDHELYRHWQGMRDRCQRPAAANYFKYGGRGIRVCDRWNESFWNFVADVGPKPSPAHSLERIDNDGPYDPSNVRWASPREQNLNTRTNRLITWEGETLPLAVWAERLGFDYLKFRYRFISGWPLELAMTAPPGFKRRPGRKTRAA